MAVDQLQSLKAQFGVTTKRALVAAIRDDFEVETGERYALSFVEDVLLDGMLEAEYQRIAGGAYDRPMVEEVAAPVAPVVVTDPNDGGWDADARYERFLEDQGQDD